MKARVSVLTPVYNAEPYLAEAIESMLNQTFEDFEFLLIDDGSSDSSPQILQDYAKQDKRIRALVLPEHQGPHHAANVGLNAARAPLIARMDADDISSPKRLEKQYDYMKKHPEVGLIGTQWYGFGIDKETGEKTIVNRPDMLDSDNKREMRLAYLCGLYPVLHGTAMFRRELALALGGYRSFFRIGGEDADLTNRLWDKSSIAILPEVLFWYRWRSSTSTFARNLGSARAGEVMAMLCALYRQAGREDPISANKNWDDLPTYLGLPKSVTLENLQTTPHWAVQAVVKQVKKYPIMPRARGRLYNWLEALYRDRNNFADRKFHRWRYKYYILAGKFWHYIASREEKKQR